MRNVDIINIFSAVGMAENQGSFSNCHCGRRCILCNLHFLQGNTHIVSLFKILIIFCYVSTLGHLNVSLAREYDSVDETSLIETFGF